MDSADPALGRPSVAGVILVAAAVAIGGLWLAGSEPRPDPAGQVHVASVENNHTEVAGVVVFTVTDDELLVDGNASTVPPGDERSYGLLDCRDGDLRASQLRIQVELGMEDGYDVEQFVGFEEGDCREGGGAAFALTVTSEGELVVGRG